MESQRGPPRHIPRGTLVLMVYPICTPSDDDVTVFKDMGRMRRTPSGRLLACVCQSSMTLRSLSTIELYVIQRSVAGKGSSGREPGATETHLLYDQVPRSGFAVKRTKTSPAASENPI